MKIPAGQFEQSTPLIEAGVLGAILNAPWTMGKMADVIGPQDFTTRAHREIFLTLCAMHRRGIPPDGLLLTAELVDGGKRSCAEAVFELFKIGVVPQHLEFYVQALIEKSEKRNGRRKAIIAPAEPRASRGW